MLPKNSELTIFVNSCDSYEDCWDPFFKLFSKYWRHCPFLIVLNTETKEYSYPGLNIRCTKTSAGEYKKLGWSECLMFALDSIQTPYILYLQEDYFLDAPVNDRIIFQLLNEIKLINLDVVQLLESSQLTLPKGKESELILEVSSKAKWRLSLQAAIWKTPFLRSHLRVHESPWQLESYGSLRARLRRQKIHCVNEDLLGEARKIYPYKPTGIVAGKWVREIVEPLFLRHDIKVDFSVRGFHSPHVKTKKRKTFFRRILDRFRSLI
jgi:hypothetical protein